MFAKSFTVALVTITGLLLPAAVFASPAADADALLDARGRTNGVSLQPPSPLHFRPLF